MRNLFILFLGFLIASSQSLSAFGQVAVVVSIKPLHSIVSAVMEGVGEPQLLLEGNASPHDATLKPSQARLLQKANLIFRIGPELESFLNKPLAALTGEKQVFSVIEADALRFPKDLDNDHGDHSDHNHEKDPHIWLDPENGAKIAHYAATALGEADPKNAAQYRQNAVLFANVIEKLEIELKEQLAPFTETKFLTFHEGYNHFYSKFDLHGGRAISFTPHTRPGAAKLRALENYVASNSVRCAFSEPQFSTKIFDLLSSSTSGLNVSTIDPLGSLQSNGPLGYSKMLRAMTETLVSCFRES